MTRSARVSFATDQQRSSNDRKPVILSEAKNLNVPSFLQHRQPVSGDELNQLRQAKLKRTKFVILSEAKDPDALHRAHTAYPFQPQIKNQLRRAKLKRTKFVILSEAEGPAFLSRHSDISRKLTCSSGHSERSEESQRTLAAPMQLIPSGHKTRFAKLTWISRQARPFEGWQ